MAPKAPAQHEALVGFIESGAANLQQQLTALADETHARILQLGVDPAKLEQVTTFPEAARLIAEQAELVGAMRARLETAFQAPFPPNPEDLEAGLDTSIHDCDGLDTRARNALVSAKITTLRDVLAFTSHELLRVPNFGRACLTKLQAAMQAKTGYHLDGMGVWVRADSARPE